MSWWATCISVGIMIGTYGSGYLIENLKQKWTKTLFYAGVNYSLWGLITIIILKPFPKNIN